MKKFRTLFSLWWTLAVLTAPAFADTASGMADNRTWIKAFRCNGTTTGASVSSLDISACWALDTLVCDDNVLEEIKFYKSVDRKISLMSCRGNQMPVAFVKEWQAYRPNRGVWCFSPQRTAMTVDNVGLDMNAKAGLDNAGTTWQMMDASGLPADPLSFGYRLGAFLFYEAGQYVLEVQDAALLDYTSGESGESVDFIYDIAVENALYKPTGNYACIRVLEADGTKTGASLTNMDIGDCHALESLTIDGNELTTVVFGENRRVKTLNAADNRMSMAAVYGFSDSRPAGATWKFSPQRRGTVVLNKQALDLSAEMISGAAATDFMLTDKTTGNVLSPKDYTYEDGVWDFVRTGEYVLTLTNGDISDMIAGNAELPVEFQWQVNVASVAVYYTVRLAVADEIGGSVSGGGTFERNAEVTVTATPNAGYRFVNWTDAESSVVSTASEYTFTLTADRDLTAHFEKIAPEPEDRYTVTVMSENAVFGSVSGGGIFERGAEVTVTATPNAGYRFVNWTDAESSVVSTASEYTFTLTADRDLTAHFEKIAPEPEDRYTVTVMSENAVFGSVSGGGIFERGAEVTVTATPNAGYRFVNWTDAESSVVSTASEYTFKVTADITLTARFKPEVANETLVGTAEICAYVRGRTIFLIGEDLGEIRIYTLAGYCIYKGYATEIPVPDAGLYFVNTPKGHVKVVVR